MKTILTVLIGLGVVALGLLGAIVNNRVPLSDPPGLWRRLGIYLGTNVAETRAGSPFAELEPRHYRLAPERMLDLVRQAVKDLGWEEAGESAGPELRVQGVVTTPLWRFKDDIVVTIKPDRQGQGSVVLARSQSRVGKGDLGANTRHILDLFGALDRLVAQSSHKTQ